MSPTPGLPFTDPRHTLLRVLSSVLGRLQQLLAGPHPSVGVPARLRYLLFRFPPLASPILLPERTVVDHQKFRELCVSGVRSSC